MAINPDNITTIRVDQLPDTGITLESLIPHTNGTELNSSPVSELVTLVASAIESGIGVGFLPVSVTDGQTLPAIPTDPSFILVGAGTYINLNGFPDLICTEELNAIMSLSDHWEIAVEIPIVAPVGVQTVTGSAVDNTDPQNPVINSTGGGAVSSVNGQTGVVSIDLESVLTEGNTANDLSIELTGTGSDITNSISNSSVFLLDTVTDVSSSLLNDKLSLSDLTQSLDITREGLNRSKGGFDTSVTFEDPTANRSITFKDESGTVAYLSDVTGVSDGDKGDITVSSSGTVWTIDNGVVNNAKVASGIDAVKIGSGNVSNTEFDYLDGVTSAIQTQLNGKQPKTIKAGYTQLTGVTGTQVLASLLIPANTYASGDGFEILMTPNKSVTASAITFAIYHDTSLNGVTNAIATGTNITTSNRTGFIHRFLVLDSTTLRNSMPASASSLIPIAGNTVGATTTFNPTVDNYITITVNPTATSETCGFNQLVIRLL